MAILQFVLLIASWSCQSVVQLFRTQSTGQSRDTTKLQFPQPWYESVEHGIPISYAQQIEVRKLPNSPDGELFFAALPHGDNEYFHEWQPDIPPPKYSENTFAVTLGAPPRVRVATKQEWETATRIWTKSHLAFSKTSNDASTELQYHGKKFKFAGKYCDGGVLSPRGQWLAVFSYSGVKTDDWIFGGKSVKFGDVFWQIYNAVTGEKVFEWYATNVKTPANLYGPTVWLEERYFLFPHDWSGNSFTVVTLPEFVPEKNPVTIQLPSRVDDQGKRVPAPDNHEVWTPLVPLTAEQAKKITAPQPVTLLEVRAPREASSTQLLFAIREETANEKRYRGGRGAEEGGDYNFRLFSTYYYAISPDDPIQARFASKEEWESASKLTIRRGLDSLDKTNDTIGGERRMYRPFPKTGSAGNSALTATSEWLAVFSYTPDAGSSSSGKMFVDIFAMRHGNKLLTTELPYTSAPVPLFERAFAVEGNDYLFLPLNTSLETFTLWQLP